MITEAQKGKQFILDVANTYTGGKSPGIETEEALRSAAKDLTARAENKKIKPELFHWGAMFESFCNYKGSKLHSRVGERAIESPDARDYDIVEAITASEFPFITNRLIHSTLIPEYEENLGPSGRLVREEDTDRKVAEVAGTMGPEEPDKLLEGQQYQLSTDSEKAVRINTHKFGRLIAVTRELIAFDKSGGAILRRGRESGAEMGRHRATWIFEGVQDIAISATGQSANTMLNYSGSDVSFSTASIYSNSHTGVDNQVNDNLLTDALDTLGLQAARKALRQIVNSYGKKLRLEGRQLLIPTALFVEAYKLVKSIDDPDTANRGINVFRGRISDVIDDGLLDDQSATAWYYGNFPAMFLWLWIWRPQTQDIPGDATRDIMIQFKYGYYAGFGATDYRQVIKLG